MNFDRTTIVRLNVYEVAQFIGEVLPFKLGTEQRRALQDALRQRRDVRVFKIREELLASGKAWWEDDYNESADEDALDIQSRRDGYRSVDTWGSPRPYIHSSRDDRLSVDTWGSPRPARRRSSGDRRSVDTWGSPRLTRHNSPDGNLSLDTWGSPKPVGQDLDAEVDYESTIASPTRASSPVRGVYGLPVDPYRAFYCPNAEEIIDQLRNSEVEARENGDVEESGYESTVASPPYYDGLPLDLNTAFYCPDPEAAIKKLRGISTDAEEGNFNDGYDTTVAFPSRAISSSPSFEGLPKDANTAFYCPDAESIIQKLREKAVYFKERRTAVPSSLQQDRGVRLFASADSDGYESTVASPSPTSASSLKGASLRRVSNDSVPKSRFVASVCEDVDDEEEENVRGEPTDLSPASTAFSGRTFFEEGDSKESVETAATDAPSLHGTASLELVEDNGVYANSREYANLTSDAYSTGSKRRLEEDDEVERRRLGSVSDDEEEERPAKRRRLVRGRRFRR